VKVIDVDGDRTRLSRKAVLREKRGETAETEPLPPRQQMERGRGGRPHRRPR
jgi:hypothetical protein